jgi:hypothetical protein
MEHRGPVLGSAHTRFNDYIGTGPAGVEDAAVLVSARHRRQGDPPALQRFMAERANATIAEVPASHVSFGSQPEAATQLILQAVEETSRREP